LNVFAIGVDVIGLFNAVAVETCELNTIVAFMTRAKAKITEIPDLEILSRLIELLDLDTANYTYIIRIL
jgi:hypothetical protein